MISKKARIFVFISGSLTEKVPQLEVKKTRQANFRRAPDVWLSRLDFDSIHP